MSDARPIPARPDLAQYKKQAKDLVKLARFKKLSDAQFSLARAHGFESWPKFAKHIEALRSSSSHDSIFEAAANAVVDGDIDTLVRLLREHPDLVRARSAREHRATLLHYVSANGVEDFRQRTPPNIVEIARLLLDAGADVNAESNSYGGHDTTLGLVATSAHPHVAGVQIELLRLLLDRGAELRRGDVAACLNNGREEAAEFLLSCGAPFEMTLGYACCLGRADVVEEFIRNGADINVTDKHGMTPLHLAVIFGRLGVVKALLAHRPNLELRNVYGGTVLGQALWSAINDRKPDHLAIIETLVDAGARVNPDWFTGSAEIDAALHPERKRIHELRVKGDAARHEGRFEDARRDYLAAVKICRASSDAKLLAHTLRHLGDIEREMGRSDLAEPHLVEALDIARRENVTPLELANTIRPLALIRDEPKLWQEAHELYTRANVPPGIEETARRLARASAPLQRPAARRRKRGDRE